VKWTILFGLTKPPLQASQPTARIFITYPTVYGCDESILSLPEFDPIDIGISPFTQLAVFLVETIAHVICMLVYPGFEFQGCW
jgi:hypothetical protein